MSRLQSSIFQALDGHDFEFDGSPYRVEVYGVYDEGGRRWVQLALDGARRRMVTLRLDVLAEKIPATVVSQLAS